MFFILVLYTRFLTTWKGEGTNLSTLLFKFHKLAGTFFSLSISDLSTLDFQLAK